MSARFDSGLIAPKSLPLPIPEPTSILVLAGAFAALGLRRRRV